MPQKGQLLTLLPPREHAYAGDGYVAFKSNNK